MKNFMGLRKPDQKFKRRKCSTANRLCGYLRFLVHDAERKIINYMMTAAHDNCQPLQYCHGCGNPL